MTDSTTVVHARSVTLSVPRDSVSSGPVSLDTFVHQLTEAPADGVVVSGRSGRVSYTIKKAPIGHPLGFIVDAVAEGRDTTVVLTDTTRTVRRLEKTTITVDPKKPGLLARFRQAIELAPYALMLVILMWFFLAMRRRRE